jgi:hypothetical protein
MTKGLGTSRRRRRSQCAATAAALALVAALGGCGGGGSGAGDRDRMVDRCVRSASRGPATPEQARSMCECTADGLIAEGLGTMDMLTGERAGEIARSCAISAGVPVAE